VFGVAALEALTNFIFILLCTNQWAMVGVWITQHFCVNVNNERNGVNGVTEKPAKVVAFVAIAK